MSCRTSSQMCASWYLPRFLLRDGSLTLMNMASLIGSGNALGFPVHYREIVQFYGMTHGVVVVTDGGGGSWMFLGPISKGPSSFTNVFFCTFQMVTLIPVYYPTFADNVILRCY